MKNRCYVSLLYGCHLLIININFYNYDSCNTAFSNHGDEYSFFNSLINKASIWQSLVTIYALIVRSMFPKF